MLNPRSLQLQPTSVVGCYLVQPIPSEDERGLFARTYCRDEFDRLGLEAAMAQCSVSRNPNQGTLRGLHFQASPHEEVKVVTCSKGRIFDVVVDLRRESSTFGAWAGVELSASNLLSLYIPKGVAHGFLTLEPDSDMRYQISTPYVPEAARGVRWDDPDIGIAWPSVGPLTMSDRDRGLPPLKALSATLVLPR